jgi:DNA repair protein RAD50
LSINTLAVEIQDKKDRLEKLKASIASANYDARLVEFMKNGRALEERREELNVELQSLTLQADTRARLDLKRTEVKTKSVEVQNK